MSLTQSLEQLNASWRPPRPRGGELTADGRRRWLTAYEMPERPALISPDQPSNGIPDAYRLRGGNIELLPTPRVAYALLLWCDQQIAELETDIAATA